LDPGRLEPRRKGAVQARASGGETEAIRRDGPGGEVAELDQILRRNVQHLAPAVKFRDGRRGNRVGHIGPVGQPAQYARIDEDGHYS
jgi:hypothetical protein